MKLQSDWETTRVVLVDPTIWSDYRRRLCDLRPVYRDLIEALNTLGVELHILTKEAEPLDIWIRDWGFVGDCYFQYAPSYARNLYGQPATKRARKHLDTILGRQHRFVPIVLDGGNLVHDGKVAILTEKVLSDNQHMTRLEIERAIISMGFERVVFIPVEPEDVIGHADGTVRFLSPHVLLVNDYNGPDFKDYKRQLTSTLKRAKLHAELVPFPWSSAEEMNDGVRSAVGCYINFLRTARGIVCPAFGHEDDELALKVLQTHTATTVCQIPATPLARLGGVLNCISLTL